MIQNDRKRGTAAHVNGRVVIQIYDIYLVDNDPEELKISTRVILLLPDILRIAGAITDADSAIRDIIRLKPDLVLCEWRMPHTNGAKLMKVTHQAGIDSEFIILTRYESTTALRSFFTNGGLDYISKPLDVSSLKAAIERFEAKTMRCARYG